jgi:hypothetical protein
MNLPIHDNFATGSGADSAEETLRLVASLPAPEGLEDRVYTALRKAPREARVLSWPRGAGWVHSTIARGTAAAVIVAMVAGGGWEVYSRVRPQPAPRVIAMPRVVAPGGFSSANAIRTPKTLDGPTLAHPLPATSQVHKSAKKPGEIAKPRIEKSRSGETQAPTQ